MIDAGIEFYTALLGVQTELGAIKKNKKAHTWKYGDIDAIMEHVRELLEKYKLVISNTRWTADTGVYLRTKLIHTPTAQGIEDVVPMPAYTEKDWDDQEMGKSTSYHRRYALQVLLNLTFEDDKNDDDGAARRKKRDEQKSNISNVPTVDNVITPVQLESLLSALSLSPDGGDTLEFAIKTHYKINDLSQLKQSQYMAVRHRLDNREQ